MGKEERPTVPKEGDIGDEEILASRMKFQIEGAKTNQEKLEAARTVGLNSVEDYEVFLKLNSLILGSDVPMTARKQRLADIRREFGNFLRGLRENAEKE